MRYTSTIILALSILVLGSGCAGDFGEKWSQLFDRTERKPDESKIHDAPDPTIAPETHYASGLMLERQGNFVGAVRQFEAAVKGDPSMVDGHNRLGMAQTRLGNFGPAEASFRRAIELESDAPALHNNLGFCLLTAADYKAAEKAFRDALALAPDFERARMNLGIALARQRRLGDAAVEFSRVVPAEAAYYNVGVVCMDMNDQQQAERAFREALSVKPDYEPAIKRLASLDGRRTTPVAPVPTNVRPRPAEPTQPSHVTVRANRPIGEMKLAADPNADAPSP
ncbi:MAG: tetratricopeptide repeat protein [Phycisphaerales bacterium]|nr:tetratricopeptide repeat protein [Phycisphaerales bacterium]MCB9858643.1 tetratricopeptide repeat protein [Phycisphaerales bacterium]